MRPESDDNAHMHGGEALATFAAPVEPPSGNQHIIRPTQPQSKKKNQKEGQREIENQKTKCNSSIRQGFKIHESAHKGQHLTEGNGKKKVHHGMELSDFPVFFFIFILHSAWWLSSLLSRSSNRPESIPPLRKQQQDLSNTPRPLNRILHFVLDILLLLKH